LKNAKLIDHCIDLGDTKCLPLPYGNMRKLFVRECYKIVFDALVNEIIIYGKGYESYRSNKFGLSGTPGIGKSTFFSYILYRFMTEDIPWKPKRIIHQKETDFFCYDLERLTVVRNAKDLISDPDAFYVIDGSSSTPSESFCFTLFISSPRSKNFRSFFKQMKVIPWYFPIWTLEELSICRTECYDQADEERFQERFRVYGGVARAVFFTDLQGGPSNCESVRIIGSFENS
jgi:hypothetical protein